MTLSSPSFWAALTRASMPPRSSADVAVAAPDFLSSSSLGGEQAAAVRTRAPTTRGETRAELSLFTRTSDT
jgi:hypothetical protein